MSSDDEPDKAVEPTQSMDTQGNRDVDLGTAVGKTTSTLPWLDAADQGYTPLNQVAGAEPPFSARSNRSPRSKLQYDPVQVGCATIISILPSREDADLNVDTVSVYGAIVALPQLARTAKWPTSLTRLVVRSWIFMFVNVAAQASILSYISKEEMIMDKFAGQMNLCDFGAHLTDCPEDGSGGPHCTGPLGSTITASRLYSYNVWATRQYVKQGFKDLFPHKSEEIDRHIDPGEYGVESWWCRVLCIFLLIMAMNKDLQGSIDLCRLLYHVNTKAEPWIHYKHPEWAPDRDYAKQVLNKEEVDLVELKIAGMPLIWKFITFFFVVVPKILLYKMTAAGGTTLLMETSTLTNMVINSTALAFILNIDEMICDSLMSDTAKSLLARLRPFPLYDHDGQNRITHEDALGHLVRECEESTLSMIPKVIPWRFFSIAFITFYFTCDYYSRHCEWQDGFMVSMSMHLPKSVSISILNTCFPSLFPVEEEESTYWNYPR